LQLALPLNLQMCICGCFFLQEDRALIPSQILRLFNEHFPFYNHKEMLFLERQFYFNFLTNLFACNVHSKCWSQLKRNSQLFHRPFSFNLLNRFNNDHLLTTKKDSHGNTNWWNGVKSNVVTWLRWKVAKGWKRQSLF